MKRLSAIVLFSLLVVLPLTAQTRIAGEPTMRGLSSRHFTSRDVRRQRDTRGLLYSKETGELHTFGFYGIGGYSNVFGGPELLQLKPGGYDGRLGMAYEFRQGLFMLQVGLGVSMREIRNNVGDMRFTNRDFIIYDPLWERVIDSWGVPLSSLTYTVTNRQDYLMQVHGQLPLLAGMHIYGYYLMGGLTFTFPFIQQTTTEMNVTSRGSYDRYYGMGEDTEWMEMDNHGYRENVPLKNKNNATDKRFDVLLTLETGYDWTAREGTHFRIGAYADMGLFNFSTQSPDPAMYIPYVSKWDFVTFQTKPVWFSNAMGNYYLHNFTVGAKVTLLFTFPGREKCIMCGLRNRNRRYR
ncbi:MAG: hypothetical protein J6Y00_07630 [Paludibacteraceae bacterium]|nr:hypothetical protein [Paludibacteraceae bacterium]